MKKILPVLILLAAAAAVFAQTPSAGTERYAVVLKDSSSLNGEIKDIAPDHILLQTGAGEISIPRENIASIKPLEAAQPALAVPASAPAQEPAVSTPPAQSYPPQPAISEQQPLPPPQAQPEPAMPPPAPVKRFAGKSGSLEGFFEFWPGYMFKSGVVGGGFFGELAYMAPLWKPDAAHAPKIEAGASAGYAKADTDSPDLSGGSVSILPLLFKVRASVQCAGARPFIQAGVGYYILGRHADTPPDRTETAGNSPGVFAGAGITGRIAGRATVSLSLTRHFLKADANVRTYTSVTDSFGHTTTQISDRAVPLDLSPLVLQLGVLLDF
ncbi:MAG: hypothetical protein PHP45_11495 [Elusimicrobiales bacterium]|nr:hypothetical protein [Elusimicrobiales bacterium]